MGAMLADVSLSNLEQFHPFFTTCALQALTCSHFFPKVNREVSIIQPERLTFQGRAGAASIWF
jgi:hypothetical protein